MPTKSLNDGSLIAPFVQRKSHLGWFLKSHTASSFPYRLIELQCQNDLSATIRDFDPSVQIDAAIANILADDCARFPDSSLPGLRETGKGAALHILSETSAIVEMEVVAGQWSQLPV
jgi:hypothetical protein